MPKTNQIEVPDMKTLVVAVMAWCLTLGAFAQDAPGGRDVLESMAPLLETVAEIEAHVQAGSDAGEPAALPIKMDIRQCVELALERNPKVLVAEDEVDAALARIGVARSARKPQANARLAYTRTEFNTRGTGGTDLLQTIGALTSGLSGGGLGTGNPVIDLGVPAVFGLGTLWFQQMMTPDLTPDDDLVTSEVSVRQVIYAGGQIKAAIQAAEALAESQEWQRDTALAELEYTAKQAYYDVILATALVQVAEESIRTFERNLADAQQMYDVGVISNFEVLRAQTELGARNADLVSARNARRLALTNLRQILAIPQNTPVDPEPRIDWAPPVEPAAHFVDIALENRPELRALRKGVEASKAGLRRVQGQYLPSVAATANYSNTDGGGISVPDGWTFTVGAEWDIYAGGRRKAERAEARAGLSGLEHQLADLRNLIELDVTQAYIQIQDAMAKVESERKTVQLAREGLRLAELRFQEGVGTQSETLDAALALTSAETNLVLALRDYAVAHAALERASGTSWFPGIREELAARPPATSVYNPDMGAGAAVEAVPAS
jgi:outer membrane protein